MSMSEDEAALVAHRIVLAHFVTDAQARFGEAAPEFLGRIREAAIMSVANAGSLRAADDLAAEKHEIITAIAAIFDLPRSA